MTHDLWVILMNAIKRILMSFDIFSDEIIFDQVKVLILVVRWISSHVRMEFAPTLK